MSEKILFVLEGDGKEPAVLDAIAPKVLGDKPKIVYTYCTHIYELYKELSEDPDLELLGLLKERDPDGVLADADDDTFSSVFLFFDYDGHVNMPLDKANPPEHYDGDEIIAQMLDLFSQETDKGKLYLSYPMIEAIQHLTEIPAVASDIVTAKCKGPHCPSKDVCPDISTCPPVRAYKGFVSRETPQYQNIDRIPDKAWPEIFKCHFAVAALMFGKTPGSCTELPTQSEVFAKQKAEYISRTCPKVAVLSSFPLFAADYIGMEKCLKALLA